MNYKNKGKKLCRYCRHFFLKEDMKNSRIGKVCKECYEKHF